MSFDLKQAATDNPLDRDDVILIGGGLTLVFDTPSNPGTDWTSYSVLLDESAGWENTGTGQPATQAEMLTALSSLADIRIRGEYRNGPDSCNLDNVVLNRAFAAATVFVDVIPTAEGIITNTAVVTAAQNDLDWSDNTATTTTTVELLNADLAVTKFDTPDPAVVGQPLIYTVVISNSGPGGATDVHLVDTLPPSVSFASATASQGSCDSELSNGTVACDLGTLPLSAIAASTFESGNEGWTMTGDATDDSPMHIPTGGNPGGYISAIDAALNAAWYWRAPAKFLGDVSAAYGQGLSFDLRQSDTDNPIAANHPDIVLVGGGVTLVFDTPFDPGTGWTSFNILLDESAGWKNEGSGQPATQAEMLAMLSALTDLRIRGEFYAGPGDRGDLDNVVLNRAFITATVTIVVTPTVEGIITNTAYYSHTFGSGQSSTAFTTVEAETSGSSPNLILNPGNEAPPVGGEITEWQEITGSNWRQHSSDPLPFEGDAYFSAGDISLAELRQDMNVSSDAAAIDAGTRAFTFTGYVRSQTDVDTSRIVLQYLNDDRDSVLATFDSGEITNVSAWQSVTDARMAPASTRYIRVRLISNSHLDTPSINRRTSNSDGGGYFDALSLYAGGPVNLSAPNSAPNLAITKTVEIAHDSAQHGDPITYTIVVANSGASDAINVHITDTLPSHVNGPDLDQTVSITGGGRVSFVINASVSGSALYGEVITNTAYYSHTSGSGQSRAVFTLTTQEYVVYLPTVLKTRP